MVADPARVRDPNRKGCVENAIQHTQSTALKGKRFDSIEEQNAHLAHWEKRWAASRIHGSERRQVQAMFEEEKPHLQPLPTLGVRYFRDEQRTVCDDTCIRVAHSSYAARPARIGSKVLVRIYEHHLEIRDLKTLEVLRIHTKAEQPGTVVLPDDERVYNPSRQTTKILAQAKEIGPQTLRLCELMFTVEGRVGQRKLMGIVHLADRFPKSLVEAACTQALAEGVYSYGHVKNITERLTAEALKRLHESPEVLTDDQPDNGLVRNPQEYAELFTVAAATAANQGDLFA